MTARGRPRSFDRAVALERATTVFWQHGYEGTSLDHLQVALGVSRPSLYAAFGDKKALFREVVAHYRLTGGSIVSRAMKSNTSAFEAIETMLTESALLFTEPEGPRGCLVVIGAINCTPDCLEQEQEMSAIRRATTDLIKARLTAAVVARELPTNCDADALSQFYATVLTGLSVQAKDGSTREQLLAVVKNAMGGWPHMDATA